MGWLLLDLARLCDPLFVSGEGKVAGSGVEAREDPPTLEALHPHIDVGIRAVLPELVVQALPGCGPEGVPPMDSTILGLR